MSGLFVSAPRPHGGAGLHKTKRVVDGFVQQAFAVTTFAVAEVENIVDLVADVAWRQAVQGHAGHVDQQVLVLGHTGVSVGVANNSVLYGAFVVVGRW